MNDNDNPSTWHLLKVIFWLKLARWAPERWKQVLADRAKLPEQGP